MTTKDDELPMATTEPKLPEEVRDLAIVGPYAYVVHRSDVATKVV